MRDTGRELKMMRGAVWVTALVSAACQGAGGTPRVADATEPTARPAVSAGTANAAGAAGPREAPQSEAPVDLRQAATKIDMFLRENVRLTAALEPGAPPGAGRFLAFRIRLDALELALALMKERSQPRLNPPEFSVVAPAPVEPAGERDALVVYRFHDVGLAIQAARAAVSRLSTTSPRRSGPRVSRRCRNISRSGSVSLRASLHSN